MFLETKSNWIYTHILQIGGYTGFDRTRNSVIGNKNIELTYLEEAYTSEHWLVRIYRVKKPHEFNRPRIPRSARQIKTKASLTKKVCVLIIFSS